MTNKQSINPAEAMHAFNEALRPVALELYIAERNEQAEELIVRRMLKERRGNK